jgi:hypothetical protein
MARCNSWGQKLAGEVVKWDSSLAIKEIKWQGQEVK